MIKPAIVALFTAALLGCKHDDPAISPPDASATPSSEAPSASPSQAPSAPAAPPSDASADVGGTFAKKPPLEGASASARQELHMQIVMSIDPGTGAPTHASMDQSESESKTERVLAVAGDAITKLAVTFTDKASSKSGAPGGEAGAPQVTHAAVSGKSYVVEAKSGQIVVTDPAGHAAPSAEAKVVSDEYKSLGKPDPVHASMPSRKLAAGDVVPELGKAIQEELRASGGDMEATDVTVKLASLTASEGVFAVTMTLGRIEGPVKMSIPLRGEMRVRTADTRITKLTLTGPIRVAPNAADARFAKMKIAGEGTMTLMTSRAYL